MGANGEDVGSVVRERRDSLEGGGDRGWEVDLGLDGRCWSRRRGVENVDMRLPDCGRFCSDWS